MLRFVKKFKILNKEICPCGSGKIYYDCCKRYKSENKVYNKNMIINDIQKIIKDSRPRMCMYHDNTDCSKNIINAHAIQNNKILSLLSNANNDVYVFDVLTDNTKNININNSRNLSKLKLRSKDKATVEHCFCSEHDRTIFRYIEVENELFLKTDNKQKFLFAYRAFVFEYYRVISINRATTKIAEKYKKIIGNFIFIKEYRNNLLKKENLNMYYSFFSRSFDKNDFSGLETIVYEVDKNLQWSGSSFNFIPFDIFGNKIYFYNRKNKFISYAMITILPEKNKSYIIISYLKSESKIYEKLKEQFLDLNNKERIELYLKLIVPLLTNNIVISPNLYSSFSDEIQNFLNSMLSCTDIECFEQMEGIRRAMKKSSKSAEQFELLKCLYKDYDLI